MDDKTIQIILASIIAYKLISARGVEAAEITQPIEIKSIEAITQTIKPIGTEVPITEQPIVKKPVEIITVEKEPETITTKGISPPMNLENRPFYADFSVPIYNSLDRSVSKTIYNRFTSLGTPIVGDLEAIKQIGKIDWSQVPPSTYIKIISNVVLKNFTGLAPETFFTVTTIIANSLNRLVFGTEKKPKTPEEVATESAFDIVNFYKKFKISSKEGMLLGFMAKNRVNSAMVPMLKYTSTKTGDIVYSSVDMVVSMKGAGFDSTGNIIGYISSIPFDNCCKLKIMYNIMLLDFMVVREGSELERALSYYDYLSIKDIGYVSNIVQNGYESEYLDGAEYYERIKTSVEQNMDSLFNYSKGVRFLSNGINLNINGDKSFPFFNLARKLYNPYEMILSDNPYATDPSKTATINRDYYSNNKVPVGKEIAEVYQQTSKTIVYPYNMYMGIPIPDLGGVSELVTEMYGSSYRYFDRDIFVPKGTKRFIARLINGGIIEVIIGSSITASDSTKIMYKIGSIANSDITRISARHFLGKFLTYVNTRPVYNITEYRTLQMITNILDENLWF